MSPVDLEALRMDTTRSLTTHRKRLLRRCEAIRADLARAAAAEEASRIAALAVPTIASVRRGSTTVTVVDYTSGEPVTRSVVLDPKLAPRDSLERIFREARRLRKGETIARARLTEAEGAVGLVESALVMAAAATEEEGIVAAYELAKPPSKREGPGKAVQERKPPYRTFRTPRGEVWVGRGAAKNDELTFRVAKPYHLWLHVRGTPGAHVVVPLARGKSVGSELLVDAAHLAAHFSDARGERVVEVSYVPRKFVRKPRGSAPGLVTMEREKVLALRVEATRIEHLLKLEDQNA